MTADYYSLLEIAEDADRDEIRAAITRQRRIWVRRQSSPDPERRAHAEQRVRDVDAAEKALLDPTTRGAYDATLARERRAAEGPSAGREERSGTDSRQHRVPGRRHHSGGNPRLDPLRDGRRSHHEPRPPSAHEQDDVSDLSDHVARGEAYLEQSRWRLAQAEFEYVREREPGSLPALLGLGAAHVGAGRVKEGLTLLEQAREDHPENEEVKLALATAYYDSAIAGLSEVGETRRLTRPMILSRRQLVLVRKNLRRIRRLELSEWRATMYVEDLADLLSQARKAVWTRSEHLRFYAIPFAGALMLAFLPDIESLRIMGAFWLVVIVAVYVVRHRQPGWKYHRRSVTRSRRRPFGGVIKKGL